ncbi:MAG: DUF2497 domain-containing protein [Rhizomicrobium sp.]
MANPQHEPTMEEILASIRKIISEDGPAASDEAQPNGEAEVLDLTQEVHDTHPSSEGQAPANDCRESRSAAVPAHSGDGLFSEKTRASVEETVAELSTATAPAEEAREPSDPSGDSVEEAFERAVRDAFEPVLEKWLANNSDAMIGHMKPVIREWLDEHLPAMLEGAVRNELARAARSRPRR